MNFIVTLILTVFTCTLLQANVIFVISPQKDKITKKINFLNIHYDQENHLLTLSTQKKLEEVRITIKTKEGQIIYQEEKIEIKNHYLLSINNETPKGIYYLEVEEKNNEIWVERFEAE